MNCWRALGIEPTGDVSAIRAAYAKRLKATDADQDADAFMALRTARDQATRAAKSMAAEAAEPEAQAPSARSDGVVRYRWSPDASLAIQPAPDGIHSQQILSRRGEVAPKATEWEGSDAFSGVLPSSPSVRLIPATFPWRGRISVSPNFEDRTPLTPLLAVSATLWTIPALDCGPVPGGVELPRKSDLRDMEGHYRAVIALLLPDPPRTTLFSPEERTALDVHIDALLGDPRMDEVAFYASAEHWFAETLARALPASEPVLARVAGHFGWMARAGEVGLPPAVDTVTRHLQAEIFVAKVEQKDHPLHKAWRELTKPAGEKTRRSLFVNRREVARLLEGVRRYHPHLEQRFDWMRVSLWTNPQKPQLTFRAFWGLLWIVFVAGSVIYNIGSKTGIAPVMTPAPQSYGLVDPDTDMAPILRAMPGMPSPAGLKADHPMLYAQIVDQWRAEQQEDDTFSGFDHRVDGLFHQRMVAVHNAEHGALLVDDRRLELDEGKALKLHGGDDACDGFFDGVSPLDPTLLPDDVADRRKALATRMLLADDGAPPKPPTTGQTFSIPHSVMVEVARRAGQTSEALGAALTKGGTPTERCNARIALFETVLAMPAGATRDGLLRHL